MAAATQALMRCPAMLPVPARLNTCALQHLRHLDLADADPGNTHPHPPTSWLRSSAAAGRNPHPHRLNTHAHTSLIHMPPLPTSWLRTSASACRSLTDHDTPPAASCQGRGRQGRKRGEGGQHAHTCRELQTQQGEGTTPLTVTSEPARLLRYCGQPVRVVLRRFGPQQKNPAPAAVPLYKPQVKPRN